MHGCHWCGSEWVGGSLEWVTVDRQTKHSQCILNERRHLSFNLKFHLAVKGSRTSVTPWASGGQVRWAQTLPCSICDKGQRLGNNNKTTFFSKRSVAVSDILQSCIFHIHFTEHLIWNLFPPSGFESVLFFNASLPLLFSWRWFYNGSLWHSVAVSSTTAFISPFYLYWNSWPMPLLDHLSLIVENVLLMCEPGRLAILNSSYAPKLSSICVLKIVFMSLWTKLELFSVYGHSLAKSCSCIGLKCSERLCPQLWNFVSLILPIKS